MFRSEDVIAVLSLHPSTLLGEPNLCFCLESAVVLSRSYKGVHQ